MTSYFKIGGMVAAALVVGGLVGYLLGASSKGDLEKALSKAKHRAADAAQALERESEQCTARVRKVRTTGLILKVKEQLLKAVLELSASNYGLASQHMARGRGLLKKAKRGLPKKHQGRAQGIFEKIGDAQTLTMRLDPTARIQIEQIINELHKMPGAR